MPIKLLQVGLGKQLAHLHNRYQLKYPGAPYSAPYMCTPFTQYLTASTHKIISLNIFIWRYTPPFSLYAPYAVHCSIRAPVKQKSKTNLGGTR